MSERRTFRLLTSELSELPPFLTTDSGLNNGYMLAQYTAAALVAENKVLCHPASVDSIPSSGDQEDHVSMGMTAALKLEQVMANATTVLGIEALCAAQAIDLLAPLEPGAGVRSGYEVVRALAPMLERDRYLAPEIEAAAKAVADGAFAGIVDHDPDEYHDDDGRLRRGAAGESRAMTDGGRMPMSDDRSRHLRLLAARRRRAGHDGRRPAATPAAPDLGVLTGAALAARDGRIVWIGDESRLDERGRRERRRRRRSTPAASPCCPASSTRTRTRCSPATARGSTPSGCAARATSRSSSAAAGSTRRCGRRGTRRPTELESLARRRFSSFLRHGTTTIETKTGYGLSLAGRARLSRRGAGRASAAPRAHRARGARRAARVRRPGRRLRRSRLRRDPAGARRPMPSPTSATSSATRRLHGRPGAARARARARARLRPQDPRRGDRPHGRRPRSRPSSAASRPTTSSTSTGEDIVALVRGRRRRRAAARHELHAALRLRRRRGRCSRSASRSPWRPTSTPAAPTARTCRRRSRSPARKAGSRPTRRCAPRRSAARPPSAAPPSSAASRSARPAT